MRKDQFTRMVGSALDDFFDWELPEAEKIADYLWKELLNSPPEKGPLIDPWNPKRCSKIDCREVAIDTVEGSLTYHSCKSHLAEIKEITKNE